MFNMLRGSTDDSAEDAMVVVKIRDMIAMLNFILVMKWLAGCLFMEERFKTEGRFQVCV